MLRRNNSALAKFQNLPIIPPVLAELGIDKQHRREFALTPNWSSELLA
jgi:hypothetical protein